VSADNILSAIANTGSRINEAAVAAVWTDGELRASRIRALKLARERLDQLIDQLDAAPSQTLEAA
jgi:hypothetical protein